MLLNLRISSFRIGMKQKTKRMRILLSITLLISSFFSLKAQIKSGSFQIDGDLNQINVSAHADFGKFSADMSAGYNISEKKINYYHAELNMEPADIYFALEMAKVSRRPIEEVVEVYKIRKSQGWGEIAKELGIKPGSPEFHALKNNAVKKSGKSNGLVKSRGKGSNGNHGHGKGKK